jgi:hypothetical protein
MAASAADPLAIMDRAMARDAVHPPEGVFLAWLLSVPRGLDPAEAARRMLGRFAAERCKPRSVGHERLIALLNDATRWPADRLSCLARGGRTPAAGS